MGLSTLVNEILSDNIPEQHSIIIQQVSTGLFNLVNTVLLEYFTGEKTFAIEWAKSAEKLTLCNLTIAFWQGLCAFTRFCGFYCCKLINRRKVCKCLMLAKHSSNTVPYTGKQDAYHTSQNYKSRVRSGHTGQYTLLWYTIIHVGPINYALKKTIPHLS